MVHRDDITPFAAELAVFTTQYVFSVFILCFGIFIIQHGATRTWLIYSNMPETDTL